jgi:Ca2+-binding RTX toxin-like protein
VIRAGAGNDLVDGEFRTDIGTDTDYGGKGADSFATTGGREHWHGGAGEDVFAGWGLDENNPMTIDLASGLYTIGDNSGTVAGVEVVVGSLGADVIKGDGRANVLDGSDGKDTLYGRGGDDVLRGDGRREKRPDDTAYGGAGTDSCYAKVRHGCEKS